ncbi:RNA polymerase sigma factor [Proteiniphilum sp. UBA5384]|mgnify:CR=1 FL=1|uniref:RNA polymerase sigma factor n=1 Tax=Proteiniphilum sp. UBA5384 TaxID=1947279 RepID=UPI0025D24C22|nr:RNA polymerase sigma-70 factor [Proteiniphilum sp. UBA5384]
MLNKTEFKLLFDTYFDAIRSFIFYRCGDTNVASDIAQDVFLKVWEKREQLNKANLKALLYKIAKEMVISNYRKETSRHDYEQSMTFHNESALSPEDEMLFEEFASSYAKALERMPETQRVVFLMNRNDELKYHEIAERLNISVKAVEKRMSSALQFIRTEFLIKHENEAGEY